MGLSWTGTADQSGDREQMHKIAIWGNVIPGNSGIAKHQVMELKKPIHPIAAIDTIRWILAVKGGPFHDRKKLIDTYTNRWVKKTDPDYQDTFSDVPYLIPFPAEGSRKAVIVVPGGGFCAKSMESEGTCVAKKLNAQGITAFVLWYRTNPYYMPYPLMDLQRAVRWVRFHAEEYGYAKDKIGAVGFSAGGAEIGLFLNLVHPGTIQLPDYPHDEVDAEDDSLNFAGLIYPALSYRYNQTMMFASFPADEVRNPGRRAQLTEQYDAVHHLNSADVPQFILIGTKDSMVSVREAYEYARTLKKMHGCVKFIKLEGAGHGFGLAEGTEHGRWFQSFTEWMERKAD